MSIFVVFCKEHGWVRNIRPRQSYCNWNLMSLRISSIDIGHFLRYMRQELTSPIASTERELITFGRQACYGVSFA